MFKRNLEANMKKIKRVLSVVLTIMLLVPGLLSSFNVSAAPVQYVCDLGLDKIESGQFKFMGYDVANKALVDLEPTSRPTWSPDWAGHFVPDTDVYTVMKSEKEAQGALVDLMCDVYKNYGSAVVFTAPKAGAYDIITRLWKWSGTDSNNKCFYVDIKIVKGDGTVLTEYKKIEKQNVDIVKKNVDLAEGEQLYILITPNAASTKNGSSNVALQTFIVSEASEQQTTPTQTDNPNTTESPDTDNGGKDSAPALDPVIIVGIVGGVLVLAAVIVVIVLKAKKKK